jgi:hypothetical protein
MNPTPRSLLLILLAGSALLAGCQTFSRSVDDPTAGMNGGFEVVRDGLPVNWLLYTPDVIPDGDYDLIIDHDRPHSGENSLRFEVRACRPTGGWHSPGFSQQFEAEPGETYTIGFWVRNRSAIFIARVGGVSAFDGEYELIVRTDEEFADWKYFEHEYTMPDEFDELRFEFNVLSPGTVWVDDIAISGID